LHEEIESGKVQLTMEARGCDQLEGDGVLPVRAGPIALAGYGSIEKIAAQIKKVTNPVRLRAYRLGADPHLAFPEQLGAVRWARGIAMLTLMTQRFEVEEKQLSVAGYADNMPVSPNETEEGRARNRRVDVVILSNAGKGLEPGNEKTPPAPGPAASPAPGSAPPAPAATKDHAAAAPAPAVAAKPASAPPPALQSSPRARLRR